MNSYSELCEASPSRWQISVLLTAAFLVRAGLLFLSHSNLTADPDGYHRLAKNLVATGTLGDHVPVAKLQADGTVQVTREFLPTAYRPPLYPCLLTLAVRSPLSFEVTVALFQLAMGLATVFLTMQIGVRLGLGKTSLWAGALVACDPILLHQSTLVMTETLAALLAVCAIGCLVRCTGSGASNEIAKGVIRYALAGAMIALAGLSRPTFLLWLPLAGVWLWFQLPKKPGRAMAGLAYTLAATAVLMPWMIRNVIVFQWPIIATTHGGYTLHLPNNPGFYEYLRSALWGAVWKSTDRFQLSADNDLDVSMTDYPEKRLAALPTSAGGSGVVLPDDPRQIELLLDDLHYADAQAAMREDPTMFAYSILVRLGRLWQPMPHRAGVTSRVLNPADSAESDELSNESLPALVARYLIGLWYLGVYCSAAGGLWYLGRKLFTAPWCWGTLLVACFMALHAFYWTDMRMRAPLVPVLVWWAAAGWNCYRGQWLGCKALSVKHLRRLNDG